MIIPYQSLSADVLDNVLREYTYREGTDYGECEVPLQAQIEQLKRQLASGDIVIVYSEIHQSINLLPREKFSSSSL